MQKLFDGTMALCAVLGWALLLVPGVLHVVSERMRVGLFALVAVAVLEMPQAAQAQTVDLSIVSSNKLNILVDGNYDTNGFTFDDVYLSVTDGCFNVLGHQSYVDGNLRVSLDGCGHPLLDGTWDNNGFKVQAAGTYYVRVYLYYKICGVIGHVSTDYIKVVVTN